MLVLFPMLLETKLLRVFVHTMNPAEDVRANFFLMAPQDLICIPMILGMENVVGVSKLLGIHLPVISII